MNELVITEYKRSKISALYENGVLTQASAFSVESSSDIGTIYVGRIDNIVRNINAAFVNISEQRSCYLDLGTLSSASPLFVRRQSAQKISIGDELLVQLTKEEVKTKAPVVTASFSLTGKYVILVHGGKGIQISKKIVQKNVRAEWKTVLEEFSSNSYGLVLRTNIQYASREEAVREVSLLLGRYRAICTAGIHQSRYTVLYQEPPIYLANIRDAREHSLLRIVTDLPEVYDSVKQYLAAQPFSRSDGKTPALEFVPQSVVLHTRYRVGHFMEQALRRTVYLNSGATIILEPTEAMTVIDVNTGKAISGKKATEQTFFSINMEAAKEIARQLRLRNLSGIIVVDFINMSEEPHVAQLLAELRRLFAADPVQTELVDVTKLGLVEITRKKVHKTLAEQLEGME